MSPENSISAIAHVIQLAIAPVFLITGVCTLLGVLANRLGRIVDRARVIERKLEIPDEVKRVHLEEELIRLCREVLAKRSAHSLWRRNDARTNSMSLLARNLARGVCQKIGSRRLGSSSRGRHCTATCHTFRAPFPKEICD